MRKAVSIGSTILLALAAFAPASMTQEVEVVDADAIIEEIRIEHGFFGGDFLGGDFFDEGEGNEEGPAVSNADCDEDPNNPGQSAPECDDTCINGEAG